MRDILLAHGGQVIWPRYALEYDLPQQQLSAISYHDHAQFDALLVQAPPDDAHRQMLLVRAVQHGNHHALGGLWQSGDHALMCVDKFSICELLAESITQQEGMNVAMLRDLVLRSPPDAFPLRDARWLDAANRCLGHFVSSVLDQPVEMLEMLLALGLPAEPPADAQRNPLSSAIDAKSPAKVALLLAHGANPNRIVYHGGNALHVALESKATDCIPLLLQAGADRSHCDRQGRTPLQLAVPNDSDALFAELLAFPQQELLSLLAVCVASTVSALASQEGEVPATALAQAVKLDMHDWWTPTAAGYFEHVSKAKALEAVQVFAPDQVNRLGKLRKAELASEAERLAVGTGWLAARCLDLFRG